MERHRSYNKWESIGFIIGLLNHVFHWYPYSGRCILVSQAIKKLQFLGVFKRRLADLNRRSGSCSPTPYHLAKSPYSIHYIICRPSIIHDTITSSKQKNCKLSYKKTPRVGLEPTTPRLTAVCSTIELSRNTYTLKDKKTPTNLSVKPSTY